MTIRFAAARHADSSVGRVLGRVKLRPAANDNASDAGNDKLLRAALRHFAAHGLAFAEKQRIDERARLKMRLAD